MSETSETSHQIVGAVDSDDDDESGVGVLMNRDWSRMIGNMKNDGYRLGLEASQEESLQFGFNSGFRRALQMALAGGKLQGELSAALAIPKTNSADSQEINSQSMDILNEKPELSTTDSTSPALGSLLASFSSLISQIPSYLKQENMDSSPLSRDLASMNLSSTAVTSSENKIGEDKSVVSDKSVSVIEAGNELSAVHCDLKPKSETEGHGDFPSMCEAVCRNKSDFWTQLERLKDQAESLQLT